MSTNGETYFGCQCEKTLLDSNLHLDNRPKQISQVCFCGICYGLPQQHMLCLGIISNIVQLCKTLQSLLSLLIDLCVQQLLSATQQLHLF